ncbi:MAG TPA: UDP-galactopyranose mutase, partial [Verrucomicrobiae bacterium]
DAYQAMPKFGYTRMFEKLLDHPNIKVMLNCDYRDVKEWVPHKELIFTGQVDEYFDCRFGKLPYRCLEFKHETINKEWVQPVAVINYPNDYAYTRVTEFKHLTGQQHQKTSLVYEFSCAEGDPYYPIPRAENAALYKKYAALAEQTPNVHFVGRLATYRYYNMDQVVAQALTTYAKIAGLSRHEAAKLQTEPRSKRFHFAMNGNLVPTEHNGHSTKTNGNGHMVQSNGRAPALEAAGGTNGNGHSPHEGNGENGNGKQPLVSNGNGNGHNNNH